MSGIGIVASHRAWWPDRQELEALGLLDGWLCALVYDLDEFREALTQLPPTVKVLARFNNEAASVRHDWSGWDATCQEAAQRLRDTQVKIVTAGTELDIWYEQPPVGRPDRSLTPAFAADLARRMARAFDGSGIAVSAAPVASGNWQDYLGEMVQAGLDGVDYVGIDPYVSAIDGFPAHDNWGELADKIRRARQIGGRPVIVPESGIKVSDAGGEEAQAEFVKRWVPAMRALPESVCPVATYFAGHDILGTHDEQGHDGFGLRRADGTARPAWKTFRKAQRDAHSSDSDSETPHPTPQEEEVPTMPSPSRYVIGPGVATLMAQHNDEPATDELFHPIGAPKSQYSETFGKSGVRYVYVFETNRTLRFLPDPN